MFLQTWISPPVGVSPGICTQSMLTCRSHRIARGIASTSVNFLQASIGRVALGPPVGHYFSGGEEAVGRRKLNRSGGA